MHADPGDEYRFVIDEASLDLTGLSPDGLVDAIEDLTALLEPLADGRQVAIMNLAYEMICWGSVTIATLRFAPDELVSRDSRVRLATLLDRCRPIEPQNEDIPEPVRLDDIEREPSWGFFHALRLSAAGRVMSCLSSATTRWPQGWLSLEWEAGRADVYVLSTPGAVVGFWRGVFGRENVGPENFFDLARSAFPALVFAASLNLRRFKGSYADVLPWLVALLTGVNDHFAADLARHGGDRNQVIREFSARGLDISPESPNTRKNPRASAQRSVEHDGVVHRCEWHGKRLWNVDRVHFAVPNEQLGGKVLIGIFVDHLDT